MGAVPVYLIVCLLFLSGCATERIQHSRDQQLKVFGIELYSPVDYRQIGESTATEEPCLKGYERSFDAVDITIGYGFNGKIRKITTRNRSTSMFDIRPGMGLTEGQSRAVQAGFIPVSPVHYQKKDLSLTLLADENGMLFGITVEILD